MAYLQHTIKALIRPGEQSGYVAECVEIPVVTQGETLDEVTRNLKEAVELHLDGEDLAEMGLAPNPTVVLSGARRFPQNSLKSRADLDRITGGLVAASSE